MDTIAPPFDESRFYLGKLCKRSHDYFAGKSLRVLGRRECVDCKTDSWDRRKQTMTSEAIFRKNLDTSLKCLGVTFATYDSLLKSQGGRCAICGGLNDSRRLAIDHCHNTGKIRGLLCRACNTGLGSFRDDPHLMLSAIAYLSSVNNGRI